MKELFFLAGAVLIGVGILTENKKAPSLDTTNVGIVPPNDQSDPKPIIDDDSGESNGGDSL